ncbi:MAG: hypothetical protein GXO49_02835 [Chlorobi bacterium]|nr:hypothetical protein [Chlorobiota bacterium]
MMTINKYRVNSLIPIATKIILEEKFKDSKGQFLKETSKPKTYKGYISSFNANCIIMTPLATTIMYNSSKGSNEDKSIVIKWIYQILKKENESFTNENDLIGYIEANSVNGKLKTDALVNILTAGSALKLAFRKFKLI